MNTENTNYVNDVLRKTCHLTTNTDLYSLDTPEQNLRDLLIASLCQLHALDPKNHELPDEILVEQEWHQLGEDDDYSWEGDGWRLPGGGSVPSCYEFIATTAQDKFYNPLQARFKKAQDVKA